MEAAVAGASTYSQPLDYASAGQYLFDTPEVHAPNRQLIFGSAPGVDGSYSIDMGFRDQSFMLRVVYVDASADAVLSKWIEDAAAMTGPVDVTIGGDTFERCFIDPEGSVNTPIQKVIAQGGVEMFAMYAVIKLRTKGSAE